MRRWSIDCESQIPTRPSHLNCKRRSVRSCLQICNKNKKNTSDLNPIDRSIAWIFVYKTYLLLCAIIIQNRYFTYLSQDWKKSFTYRFTGHFPSKRDCPDADCCFSLKECLLDCFPLCGFSLFAQMSCWGCCCCGEFMWNVGWLCGLNGMEWGRLWVLQCLPPAFCGWHNFLSCGVDSPGPTLAPITIDDSRLYRHSNRDPISETPKSIHVTRSGAPLSKNTGNDRNENGVKRWSRNSALIWL